MEIEDIEDVEIVEPEDAEDDEYDSDGEANNDDEMSSNKKKEVFLPGKKLEKDEELIVDETAYYMLHELSTGAPCLSFDMITDGTNNVDENYPMEAYMIAGTQAAKAHVNHLIVMKVYNLYRNMTDPTDDQDELADDEDDGDIEEMRKPKLKCAHIKHNGCVNRVKAKRMGENVIAAAWSELGRVNIYDISSQLRAVDIEDPVTIDGNENISPISTFAGHQQEGYALDWSTQNVGFLASGDCNRDIFIWTPVQNVGWNVNQKPLIGHTASVEDIQWSPKEGFVLASCSVDKSIRIWDVRASAKTACMITCENAHDSDINVISWNKFNPLIASGGDDGILKIWDLRNMKSEKPIATFKHHKDHITAIEWHPWDSTILASGGDDDQIALWDFSLEADPDTQNQNNDDGDDDELKNLPPQLLFIHQGQKEIKELHWHPQKKGVIISTGTAFNIFKTISV